MDTTTIDCPSCNRKISIALKPPFCETPTLFYAGFKQFNLSDILYVHSELISENINLRNQIKKLQEIAYGSG